MRAERQRTTPPSSVAVALITVSRRAIMVLSACQRHSISRRRRRRPRCPVGKTLRRHTSPARAAAVATSFVETLWSFASDRPLPLHLHLGHAATHGTRGTGKRTMGKAAIRAAGLERDAQNVYHHSYILQIWRL